MPTTPTSSIPSSARPVVWAVDDSPLEAQAIQLALAEACQVTHFPDGEVLLEALSEQALPDVLVLDWELPGITGIDVCRFLRGTLAAQSLPILMLTSHHLPEDVAEGLAAGANDYVFKPFRPTELLARVRALTYWSQLRQREMHAATAAHALTHQHLTLEQSRRLQVEDALEEVREAERRASRSERRFQLAARATRDLIWEWAPVEDTLEISSGPHPLLEGATPPPSSLADWVERFVHPDERERLLRELRTMAQGSGEEWQDAYRFRKPDGTWADVVNRALIVRNAQGQAVQVVGAVQDMTLQKRMEAEATARAAFERQLIGIVSHDLRNPLTAIMVTAASFRRHVVGEQQQRWLSRIQLAAERASRMIADLLDLTQARQGRGIPIRRERVNLHALVQEVVDEVRASNPSRHIDVMQTGDGEGDWDAGRLSQVIANLLGNALQYSLQDMPVRVRSVGAETSVSLEVHNLGTPIPPEQLTRIFEPMERGSELMDHSGRSVGLGLYIVRQVIRAHEGTVSVESSAAEGTTFTVRLPRRSLS